jgi:hypothetical protein
MNIRFTSSLTPEDESTIAPALIKAVGGILDLLPIAYVIRIDTADSVFERCGPSSDPQESEPPARGTRSRTSGALPAGSR